MINDEKKLDALISEWKETNEFINTTERGYTKLISFFITVFGAIIAFLKGDIISVRLFDYKFFLLLFLPLAIAALIAYLSYQFRWVAIARMYLSSIEKEINRLLGENYYTWNSVVVEEYVAHKNFANMVWIPLICLLFFLTSAVFFIYCMIESELFVWIKVSYGIMLIVLYIACASPFSGNERIRKIDYKF